LEEKEAGFGRLNASADLIAKGGNSGSSRKGNYWNKRGGAEVPAPATEEK
jgi:hypothetical protein